MHEKPTTARRIRVERGIYQSPATGKLEIQFTDETGRLRWRTIEGAIDDARLARAEAQAGRPAHQGQLCSRQSFEAVAEAWLQLQTHLRPRTREHYVRALDRHLYPRIGQRQIATIDEEAIADVIEDLHRQGLSGWTIRGILVPLGRVLTYANRKKWIERNPLRTLERSERPRIVQREMRILQAGEIDALLRAATPRWRALFATALLSGLRQSELLGLRWADIDFDAELIHVRRQFSRGAEYTQPKTARALRSVIRPPSLATLLHDHHAASAPSEPADAVFATSSGRPHNHRNVTRALATAVAASGLNREGEPRLRFHDLRHTYASILIGEGVSAVFAARMLGHTNPSFTIDTYASLWDRREHAQRAIDGLERALSTDRTI